MRRVTAVTLGTVMLVAGAATQTRAQTTHVNCGSVVGLVVGCAEEGGVSPEPEEPEEPEVPEEPEEPEEPEGPGEPEIPEDPATGRS